MLSMRVSTQLAAGYAAVIVAVAAVAAASHFYVRSVEADAGEIAKEWDEADALAGALATLRQGNGTPATRTAIEEQRRRLQAVAGEQSRLQAHDEKEARLFEELAGLLEEAAARDAGSIQDLSGRAEELALDVWKEDLGRVPRFLGKIRARQRRLRALNIAVAAGVLLLPAAFFLYLHLRIARPLSRVLDRVSRIGGGALPGKDGAPMARLEGAVAEMAAAVESRQKSLEDQVESRTEQLRHANRLGGLGRIAAAVAHEINTPLGSLRLCVDGIRHAIGEEPFPRGEVERYLATAGSQIDSCRETTSKLLSYAHLRPQAAAEVEAAELVRDAAALVRTQFRKRGVRLAIAVAPGPLAVRGDPSQLRQVVVNLLLNAADASPAGGAVRVEAAAEAGGAAIRVRDEGPGIPEELREEVFNPFFTTKRPGEGTGLGLSIAREIVEAHGGTLDFVAGAGPGACFLIRLPAAGGPVA